MAIRPVDEYPGQVDPVSSAYPHGKARNITATNDGNGTPWEERLANDIFGLQQSLLEDAGISPNGSPDQVGASDYMTALYRLFREPRILDAAANLDAVPVAAFDAVASDGEKIMVAVGGSVGRLYNSQNAGYSWSDDAKSNVADFRGNDVVWNSVDELFLAAGVWDGGAAIYRTPHGRDPDGLSSNLASFSTADEFFGIAYDPDTGTVLATAGDGIYQCDDVTDPGTWVQVHSSTVPFSKIALGEYDGQPAFVAVSDGTGAAAGWWWAPTSDPTTWTQVPGSETSIEWRDIAWHPGLSEFFSVGGDDDTNPRRMTAGGTISNLSLQQFSKNAVAPFGEDRIIIVGDDGGFALGRPEDLKVVHTAVANQALKDVVWNGTRGIVVSDATELFRSQLLAG